MRKANTGIRIWQEPRRGLAQITLRAQRGSYKPTLGGEVDLRVDFLEEVTPGLCLYRVSKSWSWKKSRGRTAQAEAQGKTQCYEFPEV